MTYFFLGSNENIRPGWDLWEAVCFAEAYRSLGVVHFAFSSDDSNPVLLNIFTMAEEEQEQHNCLEKQKQTI